MTNAALTGATYDVDGGQQFTALPREEIIVQIWHTTEASRRRAPGRALPWLSRRTDFWAIAFSFLAVAAFSTAPSSLYGLYEQQEHLSSLTITIVCAVYALGIVVSLLLAGHVSDWYGRRAVLLPALAVAVAAAVIFLTWRSLAGVIVARVLTGLALGAAVATADATEALSRPGPSQGHQTEKKRPRRAQAPADPGHLTAQTGARG